MKRRACLRLLSCILAVAGSLIIINVHAAEKTLNLKVTNLKDEKISEKQWQRKPLDQ